MNTEPALEAVLRLPPQIVDALATEVAERLASDAYAAREPWLDVSEAATYLACSRKRIYDLVASRRLSVSRDGRRLLFRRSWLDACLNEGPSRHDEVEGP